MAFNAASGRFGSFLLPLLTFIAAATAAPDALARRCARTEGGAQSLKVHAGKISAADVQNRAGSAWRKIAEAAQKAFGGEVNVGWVNLIITVDVQTTPLSPTLKTTVPGTFLIDFSGEHSIQMAILTFADVNTPADPAPCRPEQNSCCDECAASAGYASAADFFRSGFFSTESLAFLRRSNATSRTVLNFASVAAVEFA